MTKVNYKEQVERIAKQTGSTNTLVKTILDAYKLLALAELRENRVFRFGHIAMVYSNEIEYAETPATLAYMALTISKELGCPYHITLGVLRSYVDLAEEVLREGRAFDIVGIMKLRAKPIEPGGHLNVYVSLSKHIYNSISTIQYRLRTRVLSNFRLLFLEVD